MERENYPHWGKMKPVVYFPIFGLILSILMLAAVPDALPRDRSEIVAYGLLAIGISFGIVIGLIVQQKSKSYKVLRPIQYWPLIGLLAASFTKGSMWTGWWYFIFPFWLSVGLAVGLLVEWKMKLRRGR